MDKKEIILVGGGGHCKSCIDVIEQENKYTIAGIVDLPEKVGKKVLGYPIIACDEDLILLAKKYNYFLITLGQIKNANLRKKFFNLLKKLDVKLPVIKSPLAYVSKYAQIGDGSIIMHRTIINAEAVVGHNCILNTGCLLEHETVVGDHCHISTHTVINGQTHLGNECFVGSNTILANNINIVDNSIISAGSSVIKSINQPGIYIGGIMRKTK